MKKVMMVLAAVCALWSTAACQQKETFDIYAVLGYGIGMGGRDVGASESWTAAPGSILTKKTDNFLNFGNGLKLEAGADLRLVPHLYAQAGLCYSNGLWGINKAVEVTGGNKITEQYGYSMFGIKALLKPTFQVFDLFTAYAGFGIGLDFAWLSVDRKETAGALSARANDGQWPAFAFEGALGLEYPLNRTIILFGELQCEQMNFMASQRTITNSNYAVGSGWENQVINYQTDQTDRPTPASTPGTNVGIRVGVRFPLM